MLNGRATLMVDQNAPNIRHRKFRALGILQHWSGIVTCLGITLLVLYLSLPSQQYDKDVLLELERINALDPTSSDPAHMLYVILGIPFYKFWLLLGYAGDALRPMQVLNAFFGAAAIVILALILRQLRVRRVISLPVALTVGLSYAFWTHTEDAFFIIPAACFALLAWLCAFILADARSDARYWVFVPLLAVSFSLSTLFYQTNLLLFPSLIVASWPRSTCRRRWIYAWMGIAGLMTIIVGGVWLYQAIQFTDVKTLKGLVAWFIGEHGGIQQGLWRREGIALITPTIIAWGATILPLYEGMRLRDLVFKGIFNPWYLPSQLAVVLTSGTISIAGLEAFLRMGQRNKRIIAGYVWLTCGLWLAIPGLAVLWFDRAEVKLWLIPMFAFWIVLALLLDSRFESRKQRKDAQPWLWLVFLLPLVVGISNFMLAVWPNHTNESDEIYKAHTAIAHMEPNDLLISSSFDWTSYVHYYCHKCRVVSPVTIAQFVPKKERCKVRDTLLEYMETTWQDGGTVYGVEYFAQPQELIWDEWITPYTGLVQSDFAEYEFEVAWQIKDEIVWKISPSP